MRKYVALVSGMFVLGSLTGCDKETVITESKVPTEIKSYIGTHFSSHTVLQYVKDKDGTSKTYDVTLSEGVFLEFNRKKEVIDIESPNQLPNSVVPEKLLQFVATNYQNSFVVAWEKDDNQQQIKLNNGLELEFTKSGDFLRID